MQTLYFLHELCLGLVYGKMIPTLYSAGFRHLQLYMYTHITSQCYTSGLKEAFWEENVMPQKTHLLSPAA